MKTEIELKTIDVHLMRSFQQTEWLIDVDGTGICKKGTVVGIKAFYNGNDVERVLQVKLPEIGEIGIEIGAFWEMSLPVSRNNIYSVLNSLKECSGMKMVFNQQYANFYRVLHDNRNGGYVQRNTAIGGSRLVVHFNKLVKVGNEIKYLYSHLSGKHNVINQNDFKILTKQEFLKDVYDNLGQMAAKNILKTIEDIEALNSFEIIDEKLVSEVLSENYQHNNIERFLEDNYLLKTTIQKILN